MIKLTDYKILIILILLILINGCYVEVMEIKDCENKCEAEGYKTGHCQRVLKNVTNPCSTFNQVTMGNKYCPQFEGWEKAETVCCCER